MFRSQQDHVLNLLLDYYLELIYAFLKDAFLPKNDAWLLQRRKKEGERLKIAA